MKKPIEIVTDLSKSEIAKVLNELFGYSSKNPNYRLEGTLGINEFCVIKRNRVEDEHPYLFYQRRIAARCKVNGEIIERGGKRVIRITFSARSIDKIPLIIVSIFLICGLSYPVLSGELSPLVALVFFGIMEGSAILWFLAGQENGSKSVVHAIKRAVNGEYVN